MLFCSVVGLVYLYLHSVESFLHSPMMQIRKWSANALSEHSTLPATEKLLVNEEQHLRVEVGGLPYVVSKSDIEKYPGSFFQSMFGTSKTNDVEKVSINRDGNLFKFVNAFLVTNHLPRDQHGTLTLDAETLEGLKAEAEFYGLKALSEACNEPRNKDNTFHLPSVFAMKEYAQVVAYGYGGCETRSVDFECPEKTVSPLTIALLQVWSAVSVTNYNPYRPPLKEFIKSEYFNYTYHTLGLNELESTTDPENATWIVPDHSLHNSVEIDVQYLDQKAVRGLLKHVKLKPLAPHLSLEVLPQKLVIHREGGYYDAHYNTTRGEGHIGTLVVLLNSECTGGELEITHDGQTELWEYGDSWVAVHDDCQLKIRPVTEGARVSMIFDIYGHADSRDNPQRRADRNNFWRYEEVWKNTTTARLRPVNTTTVDAIKSALDIELDMYESVTIGLQHLYTENQPSPTVLKDGDRVLYDLLNEQYDVQVVAATVGRAIYRESHDEYDYDESENTLQADLFSPAILKAHLSEEKNKEEEEVQKLKIVLPLPPNKEHLLHKEDGVHVDWMTYIVSGLQVKKKKFVGV